MLRDIFWLLWFVFCVTLMAIAAHLDLLEFYFSTGRPKKTTSILGIMLCMVTLIAFFILNA